MNLAQPLVIAQVRFVLAAVIMLLFAHGVGKKRWPRGSKEWIQISIYGLLNITIYLGCYVIAMQRVTAGVGALSTATSPLFISFLSVFLLKKKLKINVIIALILGTAGVICASWPLLQDASITPGGLTLLLFSMLSYSVGAIYFSARKWNGLNILTINGWQTLIGGIFLLPFTLFMYEDSANLYDISFWGSVVWLAIPISIFAAQLWLWLLKADTIKAGLWLFLCPVFGFAIAAVALNDVISGFTVAGVLLVMVGLFLAQRRSA